VDLVARAFLPGTILLKWARERTTKMAVHGGPRETMRRLLIAVYGLKLNLNHGSEDPPLQLGRFLGEIDQDDLRVFTYAVEDDLFAVTCDIEGPHGGAVLQLGELARLH
jgi:hypothetical protein